MHTSVYDRVGHYDDGVTRQKNVHPARMHKLLSEKILEEQQVQYFVWNTLLVSKMELGKRIMFHAYSILTTI